MKCPKCSDVMLRRGRVKGSDVELDQCPSCGGIFFDRGELGAMLGADAEARAEIPAHAKVNPRQVCPRCHEPLAWFCMPGTSLVIDACPGCRGVWLDAGEAKALRAALEAPAVLEMTCPKCGAVQPRAESCAKCGIIVARYHAQPQAAMAPVEDDWRPPVQKRPKPTSVKESLLNFIDDSLDRLLH